VKTKLCKISIDEYERGAIITALMELRNKYISEGKSIDFLNEIILKVCEE
jgi:hypothetical protein